MMTIQIGHGQTYNLTTDNDGARIEFVAENLAEVASATAHYFGASHYRIHHEDCPLCRRIKSRELDSTAGTK